MKGTIQCRLCGLDKPNDGATPISTRDLNTYPVQGELISWVCAECVEQILKLTRKQAP